MEFGVIVEDLTAALVVAGQGGDQDAAQAGYACALTAPPASAIGNALHALNMLIAHQLVQDLELLAGKVAVLTVPPLCPLAVSPYDFSQSGDLIERAASSTRRWLDNDGLTQYRIPGALRPHVD